MVVFGLGNPFMSTLDDNPRSGIKGGGTIDKASHVSKSKKCMEKVFEKYMIEARDRSI